MPNKAPSLEFLVNQCCEEHYAKKTGTQPSQNSNQLLQVQQYSKKSNAKYYTHKAFKEFVTRTHCQENLNFLIEIYHYEQLWNKVFKRKLSVLKCQDFDMEQISRDRKGSTVSVLMQRDNSVQYSIQSNGRAPSVLYREEINLPEFQLPTMVQTQDDFDTKSFANLSIDPSKENIKDDNNVGPSEPEVWNTLFKNSYCEHGSNDTDSNCDCPPDTTNVKVNNTNLSSAEEELRSIDDSLKNDLMDKFNYIIQNYILFNSINEINLPSDVYSNLIKELENEKILFHSPLVLLPAKNAVLQLLRENIYYKFVSENEQLIRKEEEEKEREEQKQQQKQKQQFEEKIKEENDTKNLEISHPVSLASTSSLQTLDSPALKSNDSTIASKSQSNPLSLSNFLHKYHLKLHTGGSTSSLVSNPEDDTIPLENKSNNKQSVKQSLTRSFSHQHSSRPKTPQNIPPQQPSRTQPQTPVDAKHLFLSNESSRTNSGSTRTNSSNATTTTTTSVSSSGKVPVHHHDSIKYIKGPCNIEPTAASYNPRPPLKSPFPKHSSSSSTKSWSKNLLRKMRKKPSLSSNASSMSITSAISMESVATGESRKSISDSIRSNSLDALVNTN